MSSPDEAELIERDARALFDADYANYRAVPPTWESAAEWVRTAYREIVSNPYGATP